MVGSNETGDDNQLEDSARLREVIGVSRMFNRF